MKNSIELGSLKRTINGFQELVSYEMVFLDQSHIDQIMDLQDVVANSLSNKNLFVSDPRDFILDEVLKPQKGKAIGVFVEDQLIAYRTVTFPKETDWNMGRELNIPEDELNNVVHLEATVVLPEYRGNRLQEKMLKHTIKFAESNWFYIVLSTVSPLNYPSLKSVMSVGLKVYSLDMREGIYQGKWRCLLALFLNKDTNMSFKDTIEVENHNFPLQIELLKKQYIGYSIKKIENSKDFIISYGKLI